MKNKERREYIETYRDERNHPAERTSDGDSQRRRGGFDALVIHHELFHALVGHEVDCRSDRLTDWVDFQVSNLLSSGVEEVRTYPSAAESLCTSP